MPYQVIDDAGAPIDAHLDIEADAVVFHSRGGSRGRPGSRNLDYGPGLRLLLARSLKAGLPLVGAWLDSDEVRHLPLSDRSICDEPDLTAPTDALFRTLSSRMQMFGKPPNAPYSGSRVKKIRLRFRGVGEEEKFAAALGVRRTTEPTRSRGRLPARDLDMVTAEHVWEAVERLKHDPAGHAFGDSRDYDLVADDIVRLPPKAVFGLAANLALGREIGPDDFTGGAASKCHRTLLAAGFEIIARGAASTRALPPISDEDRAWSEGQPRRVAHMRRERAAGLARAKKQAFVREHGRLYCERCTLDPVAEFGSAGEACIEVHHRTTSIAQMGEGARTRLEDVECLCANCHRLVHALLRKG